MKYHFNFDKWLTHCIIYLLFFIGLMLVVLLLLALGQYLEMAGAVTLLVLCCTVMSLVFAAVMACEKSD